MKLQKKDWLQLDNIVSYYGTTINGRFQFDSFEKKEDNNWCYVTEKIGSGSHFLIKTTDAINSKITI